MQLLIFELLYTHASCHYERSSILGLPNSLKARQCIQLVLVMPNWQSQTIDGMRAVVILIARRQGAVKGL